MCVQCVCTVCVYCVCVCVCTVIYEAAALKRSLEILNGLLMVQMNSGWLDARRKTLVFALLFFFLSPSSDLSLNAETEELRTDSLCFFQVILKEM